MIKSIENLRSIRFSAAVLLLATLSACDGGIFGTGDSTTIDATAPVSNEQAPDGAPNIPGASELPSNVNTDTVDNSSQGMFQNLLNGGDNSQPLITLVNVSSDMLNASVADQTTTLFNNVVAMGSISDTIALPADATELRVFSTGPSSTSVTFSPLHLSASSITTFIARDSTSAMNDGALDVIALRTLSIAPDDSVAQVRVVQANILGSSDMATTFTLMPQGANPGSNEVQFTDLSAGNTPADDYTPVNAGTYVLTDTLARFTPFPLEVTAGEVYTIIVINTDNPVALLQIDSDTAAK